MNEKPILIGINLHDLQSIVLPAPHCKGLLYYPEYEITLSTITEKINSLYFIGSIVHALWSLDLLKILALK